MEKRKNNKKKYLALLLALFVCAGGTMAWLTSESELKNQFTIGQITPVDPDENAPGGDDEKPIPNEDKKDPTKLNGNLYEPSWDEDNAKIYPDATIAKDPYVGIGPKSEASYVYIYVGNHMNNVYFYIGEEWEAVSGNAYDAVEGTYTGGLFRYKEILNPSDEKNVWTNTPLFQNVIASSDASYKDLTGTETGATQEAAANSIDVKAYVHQAKDGKGQSIDRVVVDAAAKKAFGIGQ